MVLLETELWPALLHYLKENHTTVLIINGRLSDKSARHYRMTKWLWSRLAPDRILAISGSDARKFAQIFPAARVSVMSNIKFDRMAPPKPLDADLKKHLSPALPLSLLASIRQQEESRVLSLLQQLFVCFPRQVVALFPRHMHRVTAWQKHLKKTGVTVHLRSALPPLIAEPAIILWDRFGELGSAYELATAVFVGGSLRPLGGQNFIEPVMAGAFTVTGPHIDDFSWVGRTIFKKKLVVQCQNPEQIAKVMAGHLASPLDRSQLKQRAKHYLEQKQGGTATACQAICQAMTVSGKN
jgi:3-deoxy-D-manno-octulosonic-acid transferase